MTLRKHPDTVYRGERIEGPIGQFRGVRVTVDGKPLKFPPTLQIASGFEWSYGGAGPAMLALSIVYDATGDRMLALRSYRWFMWATVACWGSTWQITAGRVVEWLEQFDREWVVDFPHPDDEDADAVGMSHVVPAGGTKLAADRPQASRWEKGGYR